MRNGDPHDPSLLRPAIGTAVFVLVVPDTVIGLVPFLLTGWRMQAPLLGWPPLRWLGVLLLAGGLPIFCDFILRFVRDGRGTPAPIAPTRHLVVGGMFRFVRNPGYVAVVAMLLGQGLLFGSSAVIVYAVAIALAFHTFVVLYEEPTLRRQFGDEYVAYCRRVRRWLPRLRR